MPHPPENLEFDLACGVLAGLDGVLQGHSQGAPAADVEDLVSGLQGALLAGGGEGHHLQHVDALPVTANAPRQLDACTESTHINTGTHTSTHTHTHKHTHSHTHTALTTREWSLMYSITQPSHFLSSSPPVDSLFTHKLRDVNR